MCHSRYPRSYRYWAENVWRSYRYLAENVWGSAYRYLARNFAGLGCVVEMKILHVLLAGGFFGFSTFVRLTEYSHLGCGSPYIVTCPECFPQLRLRFLSLHLPLRLTHRRPLPLGNLRQIRSYHVPGRAAAQTLVSAAGLEHLPGLSLHRDTEFGSRGRQKDG